MSAWDVYTGGCVSNGVSAQKIVCPGDGCLTSRMSARGKCLPGVFLPRGCLPEELSAWECPPKGLSAWGLSAWGCLPKGVSAKRGVCLGYVYQRGCLAQVLWTERMTHTCENITFLQLPLRVISTLSLKSLARQCVVLVFFCTLICGPYECRVYTDHKSSNRVELFQLN